MHKDTILVTPDVYKKIQAPNCINLNNSLSLENTKESIGYKRGEYNPNNQVLKEIIGKYHGFNNENVIISSSGICIATIISVSKQFSKIWYYQKTYPEMKDAYNSIGNAFELKSFKDINENDLVCIETHQIPDCIDNREVIAEILQYAHSKKAFVLIDNSHLSMDYNPFDQFDVDFVLISLSKHTIGFNNSLVGALICNEKEKIKEKFVSMREVKSRLGFHIHPLDCYFTLLGIQTLHLRMEKVKQNEEFFSKFLDDNFISYKVVKNAGVFFIKVNKDFNIDKLYEIELFNVADTFGVNFSIFKYWNEFNTIRISLGIENKEDLIEAFKPMIAYIKAHQ